MDSPDIASCIIEHLSLADHLRHSSISRVWRDMLRQTWGRAEDLSVTELRLGDGSAENYRQDAGERLQAARGLLPPPHPAVLPLGFFQQPSDAKMLPRGLGLSVVDSSVHEKLRRVQIFSPAEAARTGMPLAFKPHSAFM